jgi:hypothetical protein
MNAKIRKLMEKHKLPKSTQTIYGLEIERIAEEYAKELEHFRRSSTGLYVTDKPIGQLLHLFWNRASDTCPLECSEAEEQEVLFREWVRSISWVLK